MSQAGFTPISLYFSTTAAAAPSAGNLVNGELALNITDGKLFYKDNGGVVRVLATTAGSAGDVVGPGSSTDNALVRFNTTTGKLVQNSVGVLSDAGVLSGLTGLTSSGNVTLSALTSGRVTYATTAGLLTDSANLTFNGTTLTSAFAGPHNGTVGASTPNTGAFTTLSYTGTLTGGTGVVNIGSGQIYKDASGNVGVGTSSPAQKLSVAGVIESTTGGVKFPDGTTQTTAASGGGFPAGTVMLFVQTAAPTGWTKSVTHNNKALRIVSGTAGSGGSAAFTTAFGTPTVSGSVSVIGSVGSTTLTIAQIPSHSHTLSNSNGYVGATNSLTAPTGTAGSSATSSSGGGGSHNHSFSGSGSLSGATASISVAYVDAIIATKD